MREKAWVKNMEKNDLGFKAIMNETTGAQRRKEDRLEEMPPTQQLDEMFENDKTKPLWTESPEV